MPTQNDSQGELRDEPEDAVVSDATPRALPDVATVPEAVRQDAGETPEVIRDSAETSTPADAQEPQGLRGLLEEPAETREFEDAIPGSYLRELAREDQQSSEPVTAQLSAVVADDGENGDESDDTTGGDSSVTRLLPQFDIPPMPPLPPEPPSVPPSPAQEPAPEPASPDSDPGPEPQLSQPEPLPLPLPQPEFGHVPETSSPSPPVPVEGEPTLAAGLPAEAGSEDAAPAQPAVSHPATLVPPPPAYQREQPPAAAHTPGPTGGHPLPHPAAQPQPPQQQLPPHQVQPQQYRPPLAAPVSVPVTGPELSEATRRPRHGDSISRRTVQALQRLVSATARETTIATETARAIQQPVASGRQLAITSIRGGAGKSTVAALLSLTYAHYRGDPALAIEADPALGTLPGRLGASEVRWTCGDLARIIDPSMRLTDITGYLVRLSGGGWLLPASQGSVGTQLDIETYRVVMTSLRRYFGTTVVDCETLPAEVARTALTTTQARVLVTPATVEGVAATRSVLDWMGGLHPSMLGTTVVVLAHSVPDTALDEAKASRHLGVGGAAIVSLPYDRHLAAGGAIRTELLGHHTREAAARLAAECMNRAVSFDRTVGGGR